MDTLADKERVTLLHEWFLDGLAAAPESVALRLGDAFWTYEELHRMSCDWAGALLAGCGRTPRSVGVLASKTPEAYIGLLAGLYAGSTVVPLSPEHPLERNREVARAAGLEALVVDRAGAVQIGALAAVAPLQVCLTASASSDSPSGVRLVVPDGSERTEPQRGGEDGHAYVLFTSGSTGRPKGVPVRHGNISAFLRAALPRYALGPKDVFSQVYELTFDLSMFEVWAAWGSGACLTVLNRVQALAPERFAARRGVTVWTSTPSLAAAVQSRGTVSAGALPDLRYTVFCGEPLPTETARQWSTVAPNTVIDNLYGPTELTVACTGHRWDPDRADSDHSNGIVPIGRPFSGVGCLLLDEHGDASAVAGELCVSGLQRFDGYLDPENDAGRFVEVDGARWYRTGDRVRWEGAELVHLGRMDDQVKVHGYRVEPGEVEEAVRRAAPDLDAVVLALPAPSGTLLAAFVLRVSDLDTAALLKKMAEHLPFYMLPRHLWPLSDPPLTANGKIDRGWLREEAGRRMAALPPQKESANVRSSA
ncbi:amino acid adenylation domain-containing protein [Streptomyces sp. RKND-216]|uniref:amino acid adenylation domain-containing protein n=1 Tax=Streptomyces sp. RKND-216 TaxID=2562581 RepID=UPI001447086B|nr:amino acid adenylation domain-containing protein [Streptomyces sp. RKND-216]